MYIIMCEYCFMVENMNEEHFYFSGALTLSVIYSSDCKHWVDATLFWWRHSLELIRAESLSGSLLATKTGD